jgi:tetratricopeptide (TPR) repeat protein
MSTFGTLGIILSLDLRDGSMLLLYLAMSVARILTITIIFLVFNFGTGCISSQQIVAEKAPALFRDVAQSANRQSDLILVRQGIPSYLMLIDGILQSNPENRNLLLAGAQAYAAYASVLDEDEQDRAAALSDRAKQYALKALDLTPPFKDALGKPLEVFQERLGKMDKKQVPTLFWVGNIWAGWIASNEGAAAMADLPWVEALMERVLELDPSFYYGGPHLFKAILLSARPEQFGGNLKKAREHFQKALDYGQGKFLMTEVYYAEYYARQTLNRDLFVSTLKRVLGTPAQVDPDLTLANTLAQRKAKKLLARVDEFF